MSPPLESGNGGKQSAFALKASGQSGDSVRLGDYLDQEILPRLSAEAIFTHQAHRFRKSGDKWRGGCPWHDSKSGTSFTVTPSSRLWWCGGCVTGGGPVKYVHLLRGGVGKPRGTVFIEIVRHLAQLAGVDFPERSLSAEDAERARLGEARRAVLADVIRACRDRLWTAEGGAARAYLNKRGFDDRAIDALDMGLYPAAIEPLRAVLAKRGHDDDDIVRSACLFRLMCGYVVIPWLDDYGAPLTLYGRLPGIPPEGKPKTTALPNPKDNGQPWEATKRSPLYLDRALRAGHLDLVLVEGVLDAALAQSRGDMRVVACVAAQLSAEQVKTLARRGVRSVTIALDPDGSGDNGTRRCVRQLHAAGIAAYVAPRLPDGIDPDEFIIANGIEAWRAHSEQRIHGFRHEARAILAAHGSRDTRSDADEDQLIAEALEYARSVPPARHEELSRHFFPEIEAGTRASASILRSQIAALSGKDESIDPGTALDQIILSIVDRLNERPPLKRVFRAALHNDENGVSDVPVV